MDKEIKLNQYIKGVFIYAKPTDKTKTSWIILVKSIEKDAYFNLESLHITRHVSYEIESNRFYIEPDNSSSGWGTTYGYKFYYPTIEQKKIILQELKKRKKKYIPALNKIVNVMYTAKNI